MFAAIDDTFIYYLFIFSHYVKPDIMFSARSDSYQIYGGELVCRIRYFISGPVMGSLYAPKACYRTTATVR